MYYPQEESATDIAQELEFYLVTQDMNQGCARVEHCFPCIKKVLVCSFRVGGSDPGICTTLGKLASLEG